MIFFTNYIFISKNWSMEEYVIKELIDFTCDTEGLLMVTFNLEGDPENGTRVIETGDYYYYAENICKGEGIYMSKEWEEGDTEGEGYYYAQFDFEEWMEDDHSEDTIKDFMYQYYNKENIPELENE